MQRTIKITVLLCILAGASMSARAQMAVPPPAPAYQPLSGPQLDQLLAPIALYPDPLIAQILPASTLPAQVVLADRYVSGGGNPNQIDLQPWDPSVQSLARYPNVLKWMDDNLDWTTELGQAFLNQQSDVMDSIQRLRATAYNLGNLRSTPQQEVVNDGGYLEILPANPQVIYVPVYQPNVVYYQSAYSTPFITFGVGFAIGWWLDHDFDWHHHTVIVWSRDHPRPRNWWRERPDQRAVAIASHTRVWHPVNRPSMIEQHWGDRGWGNHAPAPVVKRPEAHPPEARHGPTVNPPRPAPAPVQHYKITSKPAPNNAFIGIQSTREARTYSERGHQSMQTMPHSAPTSRPAAPAGGGGHGSNQRKR